MKNKNNKLLYSLSYSLLKSMYLQGLLTKNEFEKIDSKNKTSFIPT